MQDRHARTVRDQLRAYAVRGVLRRFEERPGRGGRIEFRFTWLLDRRFVLVFDPANSQLVLKELLDHIAGRSELDKAIRKFVAERSDSRLLAHRRINPARAELTCVNRNAKMSFTLTVKRNQYRYAVPKLLNFCQELFGFLEKVDIQYMWAHMGVPEE